MGNITKLSTGNTEGLKKQVNECIDNAHAQGYKEGYDAAVQNEKEYGKQMYKKALEDAWDLVGSVILSPSKGGWDNGKLVAAFDSIYMSDVLDLDPEEAMRRYKEEKAAVDANRFKDYPLIVKIESKRNGNRTYMHVKDVRTTTDGIVVIHRSLLTGEDIVSTLPYINVDKMYVTNPDQ